MKSKKDRPLWMRVLGVFASLTLTISLAYITLVGLGVISGLFLVTAISSLAIPAIASGEGLMECVIGFFEAFIDGILSIFEVIGEILSSIFN